MKPDPDHVVEFEDEGGRWRVTFPFAGNVHYFERWDGGRYVEATRDEVLATERRIREQAATRR